MEVRFSKITSRRKEFSFFKIPPVKKAMLRLSVE